jgi:hypothetical protein
MRMTASWFGFLDLPHTRLRRDSTAPESALPSDCHPDRTTVLETGLARSNQEIDDGKNASPCLIGADSEEKHEPVSDIDTAVVESLKALDPNVWIRRALQEKTVRLGCTVLHQCIRPRIGAHAPDHYGNPRASDVITGHALKGSWGHQFSGALERPFLHLFCFSRRPGWEKRSGPTSRFSLS